MKRSLSDSSIQPQQSALFRPHQFLDLFSRASTQTLSRAAVAVAVAWIPVAMLSALRSGASFASFLTDYAAQSRFLVIILVLILAEPPLRERLAQVAHHFEAFLVPRDQLRKFQAEWISCGKLRDSWLARILIAVLAYATVIWLEQYLSPGGAEFLSWWKGGGGLRFLSPAGTWAAFVPYPILLYFTFLWLWRHLLWARFLRSTTLLNLRLIAAHPDHLGGLGFIEASLRGQLPFSFCMGVGMAGAVANRVIHEGHSLFAFRYLALILIGAVLLICILPYCVFTGTLMQMRRRGMYRYGAFAHAVGEQFEKKWLHRADSLDEDVLTVPDFSTTTDLYGVVGNIDDIRVIPVNLVDVYALLIAALVPGIPVVIAAIPFDTVIRDAVKLLF